MGSAQNPDIFFQAREAANGYYNAMPSLVESYMEMINRKIGTDYGLFRYYGANDADHVIIAMGSVCETVKETIDYLMDGKGSGDVRPGLVEVHLYRPFSAAHLLSVLPESVRQITVLDRTEGIFIGADSTVPSQPPEFTTNSGRRTSIYKFPDIQLLL